MKKQPYVITSGLVLSEEAEFDTEPRFFTLLLKGFIVYLVVMGSMGCLLSSFKIPYDALVIHLAVLIGSLFSAFLYLTKVWENLGYLVLFIIMLGTALFLRKYISSGFFAVVNIISERIAYYFDTEVVQGYAESIGNRDVTVTIAFVYVGWVHAILLNALISRQMKYFAVMFVSFFFLTIPFYFECEPDMIYILMLMAGCIIVFVFRGAKHTPITKNDRQFEYQPRKRFINYVYSFRHHLTMVVMLCVMVAVVGGVFQLFVDKHDFETVNRGRSTWKVGTHDSVANIYKNGLWGLFNRYDAAGGLKNGVLGGINSVSLDYETDLEVTFVPYSTDRVYLRSFTGAEYLPFDNRWQRPVQMVMREEGETDGTGQRSITVVSKPLPEETTSSTAELLKKRYEEHVESSAKARMDVKNIAAELGTFLPYYVDERETDQLQMMSYRKVYSLTYYPWIMDPGAVPEKKTEEKASKDTMDSALSEVQDRLEQYLYENVPDANREVIDQFIREAGLERYRRKKDAKSGGAAYADEAVEAIRALGKYFQDHIPYTYQPGVTPKKKDFVNYFLADNKRGYCAHFASAATLILRRLGYRARYVEGYAIDPSDLTEYATLRPDLRVKDYYDGARMLSQETEVVTVNVVDAMAHAWVEVEIGGHWRVAELTPWSDEEAPDKGFLQSLIDFFAGTSIAGSASGESGSADGTPGGMGLDSIGRMMGYGFLILAAGAVLAVVIFFMIRFVRGRVRYLRAGRNDRLVMEFHRRSRRADRIVAKNAAQKKSPVSPGRPAAVTINYRERVRAMEDAGQLKLSETERRELVEILEKAGFSGQEITKEAYERAGRLMSGK